MNNNTVVIPAIDRPIGRLSQVTVKAKVNGPISALMQGTETGCWSNCKVSIPGMRNSAILLWNIYLKEGEDAIEKARRYLNLQAMGKYNISLGEVTVC